MPDVASIQSEDDVMMTPVEFGIRFRRLRHRLFNDTDLIDVLSFSTTTKKNQEYKLMKKKMAEMKALEEQQAKQQQEKE